MIEKESLEKIARTFFGKPKRDKLKLKILLFLIIFILSVLIVINLSSRFISRLSAERKIKPKIEILTFNLGRDLIRINYNFIDIPLKTETYSIDLAGLNIIEFNRLEFSCRKAKQKGEIFLKVELENSLKERSHFYIPGIKNRWQLMGVDLSEFKEINDWSNIKNLSFVIEEWNVQEKRDTVYIDEIRFKKERR